MRATTQAKQPKTLSLHLTSTYCWILVEQQEMRQHQRETAYRWVHTTVCAQPKKNMTRRGRRRRDHQLKPRLPHGRRRNHHEENLSPLRVLHLYDQKTTEAQQRVPPERAVRLYRRGTACAVCMSQDRPDLSARHEDARTDRQRWDKLQRLCVMDVSVIGCSKLINGFALDCIVNNTCSSSREACVESFLSLGFNDSL